MERRMIVKRDIVVLAGGRQLGDGPEGVFLTRKS